jgi:hypothetical protein
MKVGGHTPRNPFLRHAAAVGSRIPLWRATGFYFLLSCLTFLYGKSVLPYFEDQAAPSWQAPPCNTPCVITRSSRLQ